MFSRTRIATLVAAMFVCLMLVAPGASASYTTTGSCKASLTAAEVNKLAALSDTSRITNLATAQTNVNQIAAILVPKHDYRGLFAIFYRNILADAIPSIQRGDYTDPVWATKISLDFVSRYLSNFNKHIRGLAPTQSWQNYYTRAANCSQTPGRVVMAAITAHMVVDFPESVYASGSTEANKADFFRVGDLLVQSTPKITADILANYGQDLGPFFRIWFASDILDPILGGSGQTTYYFFQSVRAMAWVNGLALRNSWTRPIVRFKIKAEWAASELALDAVSATGLL